VGIPPTSAYTAAASVSSSSQQRQTSSSAVQTQAGSVTSLSDKTTISQAARDRATEETKGDDAYDFANIAPDDLLGTLNSLIKSGKMSLDESTSLLPFVPHPGLNAAMSGSGTPDTASQPINLFSGLEKMIAYNKSIHNDAAVIYGHKALSALERLQGTAIK
jgi:hypothetical protein